MFFKNKKDENTKKTDKKQINPPVQKPWLFNLSWKMQTVVNQGLRAPDTHYCMNIKLICRWMRGAVLRNADSNHTFMCRKNELPSWEDTQNELNYCSLHFVTHFLYALEIIGHYHSNLNIRKIAYNYYKSFVEEMMHFNVEYKSDLKKRLADVEELPSFYEEFIEPELDELTENIKSNKKFHTSNIPNHCPSIRNDDYLR